MPRSNTIATPISQNNANNPIPSSGNQVATVPQKSNRVDLVYTHLPLNV